MNIPKGPRRFQSVVGNQASSPFCWLRQFLFCWPCGTLTSSEVDKLLVATNCARINLGCLQPMFPPCLFLLSAHGVVELSLDDSIPELTLSLFLFGRQCIPINLSFIILSSLLCLSIFAIIPHLRSGNLAVCYWTWPRRNSEFLTLAESVFP